MGAIDVTGLVEDGHLDLGAIVAGASWSRNSDAVASYVTRCGGADGTSPIDGEVVIECAQVYGLTLYRWRETDDGGSYDSGEPCLTEAEAREAGLAHAEEIDEGDGEDAETCEQHDLETAAGNEDPAGTYSVYWESACREDDGPRYRYATLEAAEARSALVNAELDAANPGGGLLCAYVVRVFDGSDWVVSEVQS
jgi:hypothetical protein